VITTPGPHGFAVLAYDGLPTNVFVKAGKSNLLEEIIFDDQNGGKNQLGPNGMMQLMENLINFVTKYLLQRWAFWGWSSVGKVAKSLNGRPSHLR
jgi:hypothetical protein